jgi:hypothetical protein
MSTFKVDKTPDIKTVSEIKFNSKPLEIKDAINIEEYNIINDSELSLAILIAFKELMPK